MGMLHKVHVSGRLRSLGVGVGKKFRLYLHLKGKGPNNFGPSCLRGLGKGPLQGTSPRSTVRLSVITSGQMFIREKIS